MNKNKIRRAMLRDKEEELIRHQITEDYLMNRIEDNEETARRQSLVEVRKIIHELECQIEFLKKQI